MALMQLSLSSFRNLKDATLDFHPRVNLIQGRNAAGKTALLEAISVITQGKSFRTHRLSRCIRHEADSFLLFSRFDGYRTGFRYSSSRQEIRINGETVSRVSDLARHTALLSIDTESIDLISGKPVRRRQFIDWLLFHVEPDYGDLWAKGNYLLKQRNALLRQKKDLHLLDYWEPLLVDVTEQIDRCRQSTLEHILDFREGVHIDYQPGFAEDYQEQLLANRRRDIKLGYTMAHFNRADLKVLDETGRPLVDYASRGQLKSLSIALQTRAIEWIQQESGKPLIVLLDDLAAELDEAHRSKLYEQFLSLDAQLFVTGLTSAFFPASLQDQCRMFHVEHGMITSNTA